jgi:hypothetical protein
MLRAAFERAEEQDPALAGSSADHNPFMQGRAVSQHSASLVTQPTLQDRQLLLDAGGYSLPITNSRQLLRPSKRIPESWRQRSNLPRRRRPHRLPQPLLVTHTVVQHAARA